MKLFIKKYSTAVSVFLSFYIVLAMNLNLTDKSSFLSFKAHNLEQVLVFLFGFILIKKAIDFKNKTPYVKIKEWLLYIIPASLFSVFMVVGFSFHTAGNASCIIFSKHQFFKALFVSGGYFVLFLCLIICLYAKMDQLSLFSVVPALPNSLGYYFFRHPFVFSFTILLICYIPYIVISYPAIFVKWDLPDQILQGYNLQPFYTHLARPLIFENVTLNNHHPVIHTLLLHFFIVLGNLIQNYNFGAFLFALFQLLFVVFSISFSIMFLLKFLHVKVKYALIVLVYYLVHPFVQNYMMFLEKDVIYSAFLLLFLLFSYFLLVRRSLSKKQNIIWIFTMFGVVLFRNEGIYLIVPMLLFSLFLDVSKKQIITALLTIICFFLTWHNIIFPYFKITPGGVQEMLSIPFQQTARYVKFLPQKVTECEKMEIDAVLDYERLGEKYNPNISDPIKATFKHNSTKEQRLTYLKTWAKMFWKEPTLYLGATIANKYGFFYPEANLGWFNLYIWSEEAMQQINDDGYKKGGISFKFHHSENLKKYREKYEQFREKVFLLPVLNLLRSTPAYIWTLILFFFYVLRLHNKKATVLFVPFIMLLLVLIAGPCNGDYFRYVYPYAVNFPFLFIFFMHLKDTDCTSVVYQSEKDC